MDSYPHPDCDDGGTQTSISTYQEVLETRKLSPPHCRVHINTQVYRKRRRKREREKERPRYTQGDNPKGS